MWGTRLRWRGQSCDREGITRENPESIAGNKDKYEYHFEKWNLILDLLKTWGFVLSSVVRKKNGGGGTGVKSRGHFFFSFFNEICKS